MATKKVEDFMWLMLLMLLPFACAEPAPMAATPAPAPTSMPSTGSVQALYPPPSGAERAVASRWAKSLQALTVLPAEVPIRSHDGRVLAREGRVIELPLVRGDLQQCADTAIRLRAEYLRDAGEPVLFHATSGDPLPWARYRDGEKPVVRDNRIAWVPGGTGQWEDYLRAVFMWAGTASLQERDTTAVKGAPKPGDLLVEAGFPGHAVVLLDVANHEDDTYVLVAQGFMPAQNAHIVEGPEAGWWKWEDGMELPEWTFEAHHLRRFREP